jgi:uncharacterized protein YjlB
MKKIKIFLLATILLLAGCEDFLDINKSPNDSTEPEINQLLPGIMYDIADDLSIGFGKIGYACAVYVHQMVTRQPEYDDYNINGYSYAVDMYWRDLYVGPAEDLKLLIRMGEEEIEGEPGNLIYAGVAKILKAYLFSIMVDLWADIPYSEANTPGITKPVFDNGEQIYAALFALVDEGIADIQNADAANILVPGDDDLIYGGDTEQWIRMANTLKLKMYNQVRLVSMYNQGAVDQLIAGDLIGPGDDFMLPFGTSVAPENRHPAFVSEYGGAQISLYLSPWFFEIMMGLNPNINDGIVDPRIPYYWCNQLAGGDPENPPEYKYGDFNTIYFGSVGPNRDHAGRASFTMVGIYPCGGTYDDGAQVGPLGSLDATGAAPQRFITYADRLYIEAELMQVGRVAGDARAKLEEAIYASFEQVDWVVDMVGPDQDVPALAGSGADTAYVTAVLDDYDNAGAQKQLEIIMTQKWLQAWGNTVDPYTDYRRTGYPVMFDANSNGGIQWPGPDGTAPVPTQETREYPLSFPYDKDEVILNNNCTQKIVSQFPVFWDE